MGIVVSFGDNYYLSNGEFSEDALEIKKKSTRFTILPSESQSYATGDRYPSEMLQIPKKVPTILLGIPQIPIGLHEIHY